MQLKLRFPRDSVLNNPKTFEELIYKYYRKMNINHGMDVHTMVLANREACKALQANDGDKYNEVRVRPNEYFCPNTVRTQSLTLSSIILGI